jgi:hypothetical protein
MKGLPFYILFSEFPCNFRILSLLNFGTRLERLRQNVADSADSEIPSSVIPLQVLSPQQLEQVF